jgi:hypothetical protein
MIIFSFDAAIFSSLSGEAVLRVRAFRSEQTLSKIIKNSLAAAFTGWAFPTPAGQVHLDHHLGSGRAGQQGLVKGCPFKVILFGVPAEPPRTPAATCCIRE